MQTEALGKALRRAAEEGDTKRITEILAQEPRLLHWSPSEGYCALVAALTSGKEEAARCLLQKGSDPNKHGEDWPCSALLPLTLYAHKYPDPTLMARVLLDAGADINLQDDKGTSPLHLAAYKGNLQLAQLFLISGASTTLKDKKNRTPDDVAREYRHNAIRELLRDSRHLRRKLP